jgi:hypothetical protein
MDFPPWSQYEITFIQTPPVSIFFELFKIGILCYTKLQKFKYDPFNDYRSNDIEKSYIGFMHPSTLEVSYFPEYLIDDFNKKLSNISIGDFISAYESRESHYVIIKRGIMLLKGNGLKIIFKEEFGTNNEILLSRQDFRGFKICKLNLVKEFDPKLGWIPYSKLESKQKIYKSWSKEEEEVLLDEINKNIDIQTISKNLQRSIPAIRIRISKLLLIENKKLKDRILELENPPFIVL